MELPHILVISASAGSGKTHSLSKRYIKFLLSPEIKSSPRNILAVTFTNKAAGEMKERIISHLKEIALGDSPLCTSARLILDELFDCYSDFKIQTIDSLLTSITMSSALELGLPPRFDITLDSLPALSFVLDELLVQVSGPLQGKKLETTRLFLDLLYEILEVDDESGWDIRKIILRNIGELRKQQFLKGHKLKKVFSYKDIKKEREKLKVALNHLMKQGNDGTYKLKKHFTDAAVKVLEDNRYFPWESKMFLKEDMSEICKKDSSISSDDQKRWKKIRTSVSSLAEVTAHCRFAPFLNFIDLFENKLETLKKRQQKIFIEDLNIYLKRFLAMENAVPEIYFHLGDRITHFLIDEFQDTSRIQWEILFPLIEETLSKEGSLFYVGDRKQAIYGFRGGESRLFEEAKGDFPSVENKNIKEEFPEINYRSRQNIVNFINHTFSRETLTLWADNPNIKETITDLSAIFETYVHASQKSVSGEEEEGLVRVEKISYPDPLGKEELNSVIGERLVNLIRDDIITRFPPRDLAILVRTNTEASLITGILTGAGLPVASEETLDISSNSLVQELVSFLTFLNSPIDNLSFASFVSGDIFLKSTSLTREIIFSFLLENRRHQRPLYTLFRDKFPEVWQEHLEEYFQSVGFLPSYDLLSRIIKGYEILCHFPENEGFIYQLLEVLKQSEAEGKNAVKYFLDLWHGNISGEEKEKLKVILPGYTNAIKVLTVHKAKGLGFPIVIIPFAYLNNNPVREVYEKQEDGFLPYRINRAFTYASPKLQNLYHDQFTSRILDELNVFYVAATRAKDELYIFLPNYKSWARKLPIPVEFDGPFIQTGTPVLSPSSPVTPGPGKETWLPLSIREWQDKLYRPPVNVKELTVPAVREARERGTLVHNFLSGIDKLSNDKWQEELESLFLLFREENKEIVSLIKRFFDEKRFREMFILLPGTEVFCEKEILDQTGLRYRIDRLLVSKNKLTVIEFKCGEPRLEEHKEQALNYIKLLAGIYPDRVVEGQLVYVDELKMERIK